MFDPVYIVTNKKRVDRLIIKEGIGEKCRSGQAMQSMNNLFHVIEGGNQKSIRFSVMCRNADREMNKEVHVN
jgi:hypothetical protein